MKLFKKTLVAVAVQQIMKGPLQAYYAITKSQAVIGQASQQVGKTADYRFPITPVKPPPQLCGLISNSHIGNIYKSTYPQNM